MTVSNLLMMITNEDDVRIVIREGYSRKPRYVGPFFVSDPDKYDLFDAINEYNRELLSLPVEGLTIKENTVIIRTVNWMLETAMLRRYRRVFVSKATDEIKTLEEIAREYGAFLDAGFDTNDTLKEVLKRDYTEIKLA